ncbi:MAG: hypothetical protein KBT06_05520 [Prevotellaceae bacterium]|nr:hypothetical protein [Candidatus Colivivens equi]
MMEINYNLTINKEFEQYLIERTERKVAFPTFGMDTNVQYRFKFPNGYGASVIKGSGSYGGTLNLWELALLGMDGHLLYTDLVGNDVLGFLTDSEVNKVLEMIYSGKIDEDFNPYISYYND